MKKTSYSLLLCFLLSMGFIPNIAAQEFFIYNFRGNRILHMSEEAATFSNGPVLEKKPDVMLSIKQNGEFLAVLGPEKGKPGQLVLYNAKGKIKDRHELGYYPFRWEATKDRRHIFISYRKSSSTKAYVLLHYDAVARTAEKVLNLDRVMDFKLSHDETFLLALLQQKGQAKPHFTTLTYSSFRINSSLPEHDWPQTVYQLSAETAVTVSYDNRSTKELQGKKRAEGSIRLINISTNTVLAQYDLPVAHTSLRYYEEDKTLLVICGGWHDTFFGVGGFADVFKVTPAGIEYIAGKYGWTEYEYLPETDTLYLLALGPFLEDHLNITRFASGQSEQVPTGPNIYRALASSYIYYFPYSVYRFPGSDYVIVTCPQNGDIRFFDLSTNQLLGETERLGFKPWWSTPGISPDPQAVVSTNAERSKFYVLSYVHDDIAIYDTTFKDPKLVQLPEPALGMYLIRQPKYQTLVATEKHLYKFNQAKASLKRIAKFKNKARRIKLYHDEHRIILRTDKELLVLNPRTLKVQQRFIYNKVRCKQVRSRYGFLEPFN